jgi:hypothetical protein
VSTWPIAATTVKNNTGTICPVLRMQPSPYKEIGDD